MRPTLGKESHIQGLGKGRHDNKGKTNDQITQPRITEITEKRSCNENGPTESELPGSLVRQPSGDLCSRNCQWPPLLKNICPPQLKCIHFVFFLHINSLPKLYGPLNVPVGLISNRFKVSRSKLAWSSFMLESSKDFSYLSLLQFSCKLG